jgi:hypothetical protein
MAKHVLPCTAHFHSSRTNAEPSKLQLLKAELANALMPLPRAEEGSSSLLQTA